MTVEVSEPWRSAPWPRRDDPPATLHVFRCETTVLRDGAGQDVLVVDYFTLDSGWGLV